MYLYSNYRSYRADIPNCLCHQHIKFSNVYWHQEIRLPSIHVVTYQYIRLEEWQNGSKNLWCHWFSSDNIIWTNRKYYRWSYNFSWIIFQPQDLRISLTPRPLGLLLNFVTLPKFFSCRSVTQYRQQNYKNICPMHGHPSTFF